MRKYVVKRPLTKESKKPRVKAPKIQRLITPRRLQRKRHLLALKKRRAEKQRVLQNEYADSHSTLFYSQGLFLDMPNYFSSMPKKDVIVNEVNPNVVLPHAYRNRKPKREHRSIFANHGKAPLFFQTTKEKKRIEHFPVIIVLFCFEIK